MTATEDLIRLKKELQALKNEDPKGFATLLNEIANEKNEEISDEFKKIMNENFHKFDETYKALA
jgi:hypothetical protein